MPKLTKNQAKQIAEEMITLQPMLKRYRQIEGELKMAMPHLKMDKIETHHGVISVSVSERVTFQPAAVRSVLGEEMSGKVIKIAEKVSTPLMKTFHEVGDITDGQMDDLLEKAKKQTVVSFRVKPL